MKLHQLICLFACICLSVSYSSVLEICSTPFLLYVSKQSISNSFSKYLLGKGGRECKIVFQFYFITSSDDFTFGPNLLICNNRSLSDLGLNSKCARLEYWYLKYLFRVSNFFFVKPLPKRLPWPVTFLQNIFYCEP